MINHHHFFPSLFCCKVVGRPFIFINNNNRPGQVQVRESITIMSSKNPFPPNLSVRINSNNNVLPLHLSTCYQEQAIRRLSVTGSI